MSRRPNVRKRRVNRQRVPREARPISKDNSVIGVLSFVGAFLFLVLIGIIFIDSGQDSRDDYQEEFVYDDDRNNDRKPERNKTTQPKKPVKQPPVVAEKPKEEEKNENKKPATEKLAQTPPEKQQGLLPKENKAPQVKPKGEMNLSVDEKYRIQYERARRSGDVPQLMKLATWCEEQEMPGRAEDVYRQVIKIEPNNNKAREALGYMKLGSTWAKEEDAERLGYYKYKDEYVSAESLRKKGLYLYDGDWLSKQEIRRQNLVIHEDEVMTKEDLKALKKRKKEEKEQLASREEKPKRKLTYGEQLTLSFRQIRIYTPPVGRWALSSSGRGAQAVSSDPIVSNGRGGLKDTLVDAESNITLTIQGYSPEILYTFADGSSAQGSEILNLLKAYRGESFNLYQGLRFDRIRRKRYGSETFTQQFGIGYNEKVKYAILLTFFRFGTLTYAMRVSYPVADNKQDNKLIQQKVNYLFTYMKKTRDDY